MKLKTGDLVKLTYGEGYHSHLANQTLFGIVIKNPIGAAYTNRCLIFTKGDSVIYDIWNKNIEGFSIEKIS